MEKQPQIETWRKVLYYFGNILTVLGIVTFLSIFLTFFTQTFNPFEPMVRPFIGIILIIIGQVLAAIGKRGLAGSGVLLDPQKARVDYKPYTKALGGMIQDGLEEVDVLKKESKEVIKVGCQSCGTLNDEHAKFCDECGRPL